MKGSAVRARLTSLRRMLKDEKGLVFLEYSVFAAFLLLMIIGIYLWLGPKLKTWVSNTYDCFTEQTTTADCSSRSTTQN
jgi:Flp pilus assembly pilin Flp